MHPGFAGVPLYLAAIFLSVTDVFTSIGPWFLPYAVFSAVIGLVCMIGLWKMQKWSVIAYTALFALGQVVSLASGLWNIVGTLVPAILIVVMMFYFSEME